MSTRHAFIRALVMTLAAATVNGAAPGGTTGTADLLDAVQESWLSLPGVYEVVQPGSGQKYLVATGVASLPVRTAGLSAQRFLAMRARMDAIRRLLEHERGGVGENVLVESQISGIVVLSQRPDANDPQTLLITIAVPTQALAGLVSRPLPAAQFDPGAAFLPATQPASQPATQPAPDHPHLARLARAAGLIGGTVKDAVLTGPDDLARDARQALEAEDLNRADELIERLARISAGQLVLAQLNQEMSLRRALADRVDSEQAFMALASWADRQQRLGAVLRPLERSARVIVDRAGAEAFVQDPAVFFWLGRSAQAAAKDDLAERAYSLAVQFGVGNAFHPQAADSLLQIRQARSQSGGGR